MSNWYKFKKEANKEQFLLKQKPKNFSLEDWTKAVKWALDVSRKHAVWLTNIMRRNPKEFIFGEDDQKVKEALEIFTKARKKREFEKKDLNQYKSYEELAEAIAPYREVKSIREKERDARQDGLSLIDKDGEYSLYELLNFEAAHSVAQRTEWCVSWEDNWNGYKSQGPLFYISKDGEPYCLMHAATSQFKNVSDTRMSEGATVPILSLLEKNADKIGISQLFGKQPQELEYNEIYGNDFSIVYAAAKEKEVLRQIIEESKRLDDFLVSPIVNRIHKRFADIDDIDDRNPFIDERKPDFWKELELLSTVEKQMPKGAMEHVIDSYANHVLKKLQVAYGYSYQDPHTHWREDEGTMKRDMKYTIFHYLTTFLSILLDNINKFPSQVTDTQKVREGVSRFLEVKFQDLENRVLETLKEGNEVAETIKEHDAAWDALREEDPEYYEIAQRQRPRKDNHIDNQLKGMSSLILETYNRIKDRFKSQKIVEMTKGVHHLINDYIFEHNEYSSMEYIKIHNQAPEEVSDPRIKDGAKKSWMHFIEENPTRYKNGINEESYYNDNDVVKITPDLEKELAQYTGDIYIKMAKEPARDTSAFDSKLTEKMHSSHGFIDSIPVTIHESPEVQKSLMDIIDHGLKLAATGPTYELEAILGQIKKSMLTPAIASASLKGIKLIFESGDSVVNTNRVLNEFPEWLRELPATKKEVLNGFRNNFSENDVQYSTMGKYPANNNIMPGTIPDYVLADKQFRDVMTRTVLRHMAGRDYSYQQEQMNTRSMFRFTYYGLDDYLPDFVVNHPDYERAKAINLAILYRKEIRTLFHEKLETPRRVQQYKDRIAQIEKDLSEIDFPENARKILEDELATVKDNLEKAMRTMSEQEARHGQPRIQKIWSQKVVKIFNDAVNNAQSIFDQITDPMAGMVKQKHMKGAVLEQLPWYVNDFPDLKEKLVQLYEKDKEKINVHNFRNIDKAVVAATQETDIFDRLTSLIPELNQIELQKTRPLIEEYAQNVINTIHSYYSTWTDNPDMGREANERRRSRQWEMNQELDKLRRAFQDQRRAIMQEEGLPRVAWITKFFSGLDKGKEDVDLLVKKDRQPIAAEFYDKFEAITDQMPLESEEFRSSFKNAVYQQLREVFTVEYYAHY